MVRAARDPAALARSVQADAATKTLMDRTNEIVARLHADLADLEDVLDQRFRTPKETKK